MDNATSEQTISNRRHRGGRPRLTPEERRGIQIKIGFTEAEFGRLSERAVRSGLRDIEFVRRMALSQEIHAVPQINKEAVAQLNRIGQNLNQIARKLNSGEDAEVLTEVVEVKRLIQSFTRQLLGTA